MRSFHSALVAVLLAACAAPALTSAAAAQSCTCSGAGIRADEAPPPLPDYEQPPMPEPGYLWTPGYWAWNNYEYYWVPGTWVEPPRPGLLWTPGYWAFVDGVYAYNPGYWGPHVGFYGGVSYGYGYGGVGYEGGYWDGNRFFYNRSVNNVRGVHVENVYEKNVTIENATNNHSSFNGPGGTLAKPTPEEEAFGKEPHVPPSKGQIDHARTASMKSDLFVSSNHGKPAIAATAKPAAFTGPGVVRATAAGAGPVHPANGQPAGEEPTGNKGAPRGPETKVAPTPGAEKSPPAGEFKPGPKPSSAVEPEKKLTPAQGEEKPRTHEETKPAPKPSSATGPEGGEKRMPGGPEKKPETAPMEHKESNGERRAPDEQAKRPPNAHGPEKEHCGKPGEPKCP